MYILGKGRVYIPLTLRVSMVKKGDIKKKKGGKKKMETLEVAQTLYREICPICNKELTSQYRSQLRYNLKIHIEACKRKNLSTENK